MELSLSEEQELIRDSARKFVAGTPLANEPTVGGGDGSARAALWRELASHGFLAIGLPPEYGGLGGAAELAIVCREFGKHPLRAPYVSSAVFPGQLLAAGGSAEQKSALLPKIIRGELTAAVAYCEPDGQLDAAQPTASATRHGLDYVLNGRKCLVLNGGEAELLMVSARIDDGDLADNCALFLLERAQAGVSLVELPLLDGTRCADVNLKDVRVTRSSLVGMEGNGSASLRHALRYATLAACSEIAGAVSQALQVTVSHVRNRKQFGVALADFQAVRAKLADMAMDCEMAWAAVCTQIASFDDPGQHDPQMTAAMAKVVVDDIGQRVCGQAIQLHGAMGITEECGVGRYYKLAVLTRALYGSSPSRLLEYSRGLAQMLHNCVAAGRQP
ncbi:MAG: acyl-CoA dehydrogenase family protein [Steroidobacteraceae bacterium]